MKKVFSIVAVAVFTLGLTSCEAETNIQDTESLFETLEQDASDEEQSDNEEREG